MRALKNWQRIAAAGVISLLLFASCDAEKRVARILTKYPEAVQQYNDTVRVPVQIIDSITVESGDTLITWYYVKDTIYETIISRTTLNVSDIETRQDKRLRHKNERKAKKEEEKTERKKHKQEEKTERVRERKKSPLMWALWIFLIILAFLVLLFGVRFINQYFNNGRKNSTSDSGS